MPEKKKRRRYNTKTKDPINLRRYKGTNLKVLAAQITDSNIVAISRWCFCDVSEDQESLIVGGIEVAGLGDYVILESSNDMIFVNEKVFEMSYKEMEK